MESETSLLAKLVNFNDYFYELVRRVTQESLPDSDLTIADIFVPPVVARQKVDLRRAEGELPSSDLSKELSSWLTEPGQRHIALLGEYGQGKSTAALMLTYELLSKHGTGRIPLLIELRGMSPATLPPLQLLGAWCSPYGIDPRALMKLIISGQVVMILDAFDEMAEAGDPEARLNHFRSLWRFALPRNKILITGRPNFFLDESELKTSLGIERATGAGPYCEALYLRFFDVPQIEQNLLKMNQTRASEIVALSRKDPRFLDIVARPSLLYIVAILWEDEKLSERSNLTSAEVIELFVRNIARRQEEKASGGREFMILTSAEREYFTDGVAAYIAASGSSNQILLEQYQSVIARLFDELPSGLNLKVSALASQPMKSLTERLRGRPNPLRAIETDVRTYGTLVADYSKPGALRFAHKSFFEFTFSSMVASRILGLNREATAAIMAATSVNLRSIVEMPEALAFMGEIVAKGSSVNDDKSEWMQSLFNAIVLRGKLKLPRRVTSVLLAELKLATRLSYSSTAHRVLLSRPHDYVLVRGWRRSLKLLFVRPSAIFCFVIALLWFLFNFDFLESEMQSLNLISGNLIHIKTLGIFFYFVLGANTFLVMAIQFGVTACRINRDVELWYLVISEMNWADDIVNIYGRMARIDERYVPRSNTIPSTNVQQFEDRHDPAALESKP